MLRIFIFSVVLFLGLNGNAQEVKKWCSIEYAVADTSTILVPEISTKQLKQILATDSALLLDTRPYEEWTRGHLPKAINVSPKPGIPISLYTSDVHEILRLVKGNKNKALILYCNGPFCGKSKRLSADLVKEGFTNVVIYQAGIPVWQAAGNALQVERTALTYFWMDLTAVWVDARDEANYKQETIKGAVNIPFNRLTGIKDSGMIKQAKDDGRLPMYDHNTRIVIIGDNIQQAITVSEAITKEAFHNVCYFNGSFQEARETLKEIMLPDEEKLRKKLKETEVDWNRINRQSDTAGSASLLAAEFIHIDVNGKASNKTERLQKMSLLKSASSSSYEVEHNYSIIDRTAIVTFRSLQGNKKIRNTHIYVWRDGRWQAVFHHDSFIPE